MFSDFSVNYVQFISDTDVRSVIKSKQRRELRSLRVRFLLSPADPVSGSSLVAASPDVHLLRLRDKLVPELRMRDVNQVFRSLPGRAALHHRHAVLCHDVHSVRAGICDDTAVRQSRSDSAYEIALLVCESG